MRKISIAYFWYLSHINLECYSTVLIFGTSWSRRDAEITECSRSEPNLVGEVGAAWSGGRSPSSPAVGVMRQREIPPPIGATVATLCPFLLPPIRRHRSVIRNYVSLSSPCRESRLRDYTNAIARISLRISLPFTTPFFLSSFTPVPLLSILSLILKLSPLFLFLSMFFRFFSPFFMKVTHESVIVDMTISL